MDGVVSLACSDVRQLLGSAGRRRRSGSRQWEGAETLLATAAEIAPGAPCVVALERELWWKRAMRALRFPVLAVALALPLGLVVLLSRRRWRALQATLDRLGTKTAAKVDVPGMAERLDESRWSQALAQGLARAGESLGEREEPAAARSSALLAAVGSELATLGSLSRDVALGALQTGELRSMLLRLPAALVYLVVFPSRSEHAHLVRREAAFADGWVAHFARLRRRLAAEGDAETPVVSLLVFLGPDARDGALVVATSDGEGDVLPGVLLDEEESDGAAGLRQNECYRLSFSS